MSTHTSSNIAGEPVASASAPCCPYCHGPVRRVRRHLGDRLLSMFYSVHRFQCDSMGCNWEGLLRPQSKGGKGSYRSRK